MACLPAKLLKEEQPQPQYSHNSNEWQPLAGLTTRQKLNASSFLNARRTELSSDNFDLASWHIQVLLLCFSVANLQKKTANASTKIT